MSQVTTEAVNDLVDSMLHEKTQEQVDHKPKGVKAAKVAKAKSAKAAASEQDPSQGSSDWTQKIVTTTTMGQRKIVQTRIVNADGTSRLVPNDKYPTTPQGSHPKTEGSQDARPKPKAQAAAAPVVDPKPKKPCRDGADCPKMSTCKFEHPAHFRAYVPAPPPVRQVPQQVYRQVPQQVPQQVLTMCRYGFDCKNLHCHFVHPAQVACRFGENCQKSDCQYTHLLPVASAAQPMRATSAALPPWVQRSGRNGRN